MITETLFALHQNGQRVDAIHLISTREGTGKALTALLDPDRGRYFQYLKEYGIDPRSIDFGPQNIHRVTDPHGREALDIADEADNENLLRKCLDLAFHFTGEKGNAVFFSVAGGRKTMSACLTLAAQMYGRPQDRIYPVLVSPEFESSPEFYYPPRQSRLIELKDKNGNPYFKETRYAEVNLIPLPFASIRYRFGLNAGKDLDLVSVGRRPNTRDPGTVPRGHLGEKAKGIDGDSGSKPPEFYDCCD